MGTINQKPDITKEESGLQQYDGLAPSREPEISYTGGKRNPANDLGDRSAKEDKAMIDAMNRARDNRRDEPSEPIN